MVDHRDSVVARSKWELPLPDQKLSGGGEIIFRRTAGGATTVVRQCLNIQLSLSGTFGSGLYVEILFQSQKLINY